MIKGSNTRKFFYNEETETAYSRYWSTIRNITKEIFPSATKNCSFLDYIFITNLAKCNVYRDNGYQNETPDEFFYRCSNILNVELSCLKPTHIIFFTSLYYDFIIDKLSSLKITDSKIKECKFRKNDQQEIPTREYTALNELGLPVHMLMTGHPQGTSKGFESFITEWIMGAAITVNYPQKKQRKNN